MIFSSSAQEVAVGKEMKKRETVAAWQASAVKIELSCKDLDTSSLTMQSSGKNQFIGGKLGCVPIFSQNYLHLQPKKSNVL